MKSLHHNGRSSVNSFTFVSTDLKDKPIYQHWAISTGKTNSEFSRKQRNSDMQLCNMQDISSDQHIGQSSALERKYVDRKITNSMSGRFAETTMGNSTCKDEN